MADHEKIVTLTTKNFAPQIKKRVVLIDFGLPGVCLAVLNAVARELTGDARVGKVDIEKNQSPGWRTNTLYGASRR